MSNNENQTISSDGIPEDEVRYYWVGEGQSLGPCRCYVDTFKEAARFAKRDQPEHRPFRIIKCTMHYEEVGHIDEEGKLFIRVPKD